MDLRKIQEEIFGKENEKNFFSNTNEIKKSVHSDIEGRNLLLDLIDSPMFLPLFNPLDKNEMVELINRSDLTIQDSNGNNALLLAMDKNLYIDDIITIANKSNLAHKNKEGVNALTIAVLHQNLLSPNFLYDLHNSRDEAFSKTIKELSSTFLTNRNLTPDNLKNKYATLQTILKKYEKKEEIKKSLHIVSTEKNKI